MKVWNEESGWHKVESIYIVEDSFAPDSQNKPETAVRSWRILVCGESKGDLQIHPGFTIPDDAVTYFVVRLPLGKSLDECLKEAYSRISTIMKPKLGEKLEETDWLGHFRWAMNAVLYTTWEEPGEHWEANKEARQLWERIQKVHGPKRERLKERLKSLDRQPRIRLGYKIRVNRHGEKSLEEGKSVFTQKSGLGVRQRVSGHWKRQPCGLKSQDRKIIWVQPYWRNEEGEAQEQSPVHVMQ
jgi:hypothetical protein